MSELSPLCKCWACRYNRFGDRLYNHARREGPIIGVDKTHWATKLTVWWLKKRLKKASPEKQVQFARIMKRNYPDLYRHLLKEVDIVEV